MATPRKPANRTATRKPAARRPATQKPAEPVTEAPRPTDLQAPPATSVATVKRDSVVPTPAGAIADPFEPTEEDLQKADEADLAAAQKREVDHAAYLAASAEADGDNDDPSASGPAPTPAEAAAVAPGKAPKVDGHPELPVSYFTEDGGQHTVSVTRPWGPIVVAITPKGWHGGAALELPLEDLEALGKLLVKVAKAHKGQA